MLELFDIKEYNNIFYIFDYEPHSVHFSGGVTKDSRSYKFKVHFTNHELFSDLLECIKGFLDINISIAIPSSNKKDNSIQKINDNRILIKPVSRRDSRHHRHKEITVKSEMARLELVNEEKLAPKKILLFDDITTTGNTLHIYEQIIKEYLGDIQVVKFAFAGKIQEYKKVGIIVIKTIDLLDDMDFGKDIILDDLGFPEMYKG